VRAAPGFPIGGEDVHREASGAYTGSISAAMLVDAGATLTIVGHSERREGQGESDADVKGKAETALAAGLGVILCVGESDRVRESGRAVDVVREQLEASLPDAVGEGSDLAVAYEPIWAIGTGKIPTIADIAEMHAALREQLETAYGDRGRGVRILYGGSVKASNAAEIFAVPDVDGALVGGASLKAIDFLPIVKAGAEA
jgi:triosephosphate isomerase